MGLQATFKNARNVPQNTAQMSLSFTIEDEDGPTITA